MDTPTSLTRIPPEDLTLIRELGRGTYGKVKLADSKTYRKVAVKYTGLRENEAPFDEFLKEAKILCDLKSPNIIRFYGITRKKEQECIVMEYAENGTLFEFLKKLRNEKKESTFSWDKRYDIALDITRGLILMHRENVLHRDLKSPNILLDTNMVAKISDFGLSKIKNSSQMKSNTPSVVGTYGWIAPEAFSDVPYTEKVDIFSLGIIFWEIASCQFPYEGINDHIISNSVLRGERLGIPSTCPIEFKDLIEKCWSQKPDQRPSAADIYDIISRIISDNSKNITRNETEYKNRIEEQNKLPEEDEKIKATEFQNNDIFIASAQGKVDVICELLKNGAKVDQEFQREAFEGKIMKYLTPLHFAARYSHLNVVMYLVQEGAIINSNNINISPPLHWACECGNLSIVQYLVKKGALINAKGIQGRAPIHFATNHDHLDIVKYLVENGAAIDQVDQKSETPLHLASYKGYLSIVEYLIANGAQIDVLNSSNSTPLHNASYKGHFHVVKKLVEKGANIELQDFSRNTPIRVSNNNEIIRYLRSINKHKF